MILIFFIKCLSNLALCVCFVDHCLSFCPFCFGHCVVLQFMDSDYPFGIFKLFLFSFSKHLLLFKEFKINKIGGTYDTSMLDHLKCTF